MRKNNKTHIFLSCFVFVSTIHISTITKAYDAARVGGAGFLSHTGYALRNDHRIQLCSMAQLQNSQNSIQFLSQTKIQKKEVSKPVFRSGPTHIDNYFSSGTYSTTGTDMDQLSIPGSINTITAPQIQDRAATDLQKTLEYTPGVSVK
jgi:outer membrane receptor for ferric coprogen and ferric-rhodotorulic acid